MLAAVLFIVALVGFLYLCAADCNSDERREDPDVRLCRKIGIVVLALVMLCNTGIKPAPVNIRSTSVSFWNRNTHLVKGRWEVSRYRHPDSMLIATDYMMGVELAKTNACSFFDLTQDADIDRLKRCFHFFPDMRNEYITKYEEQVGICI